MEEINRLSAPRRAVIAPLLIIAAAAANAWFIAFNVAGRVLILYRPGQLWVVFIIAFAAVAGSCFLVLALLLRRLALSPGPHILWALFPVLGSIPIWIFSRYDLAGAVMPLVWPMALAAASTAGAVAWVIYATGPARPAPASVKWQVAAGLMLILALAGFALYRINWSLIVSGDLAIYDHAFWGALHGQGLLPSLLYRDSLFREHLDLMLLALLPAYALWPGPGSLTLALLLTLAASGLIAVRFLPEADRRYGLLVFFAFMLHPGVCGQYLNCFHGSPLALPFLAGAYFYYRAERARPFYLLLILAQLCSEYICFTLIMFPVLAFLDRRSIHWKAAPLVLGLGYGGLAYLMLAHPSLTVGRAAGQLLSPLELMHRVMQRTDYLERMFLPVLVVLPFLGRSWILSLPAILISLLLIEDAAGRVAVYMHTSAVANLFLIISAVEGINRLRRRFPSAPWPELLLPVMLIVSLSFDLDFAEGPRRSPDVVAQVQKITGREGVTASRRLCYHLSRRPVIRFYDARERTQWVVIDYQAGWERGAFRPFLDAVAADPDYVPVLDLKNDLRIYKLQKPAAPESGH
jgi:uncharacterized membrane protein